MSDTNRSDELQREFTQSLKSTSKVLYGASAALIIISLLVDQQVRDQRRTLKLNRRETRRLEQQIGEAQRRVSRRHRNVIDAIQQAKKAKVDAADLTIPAEIADDEKATLETIEKLAGQVRVALDRAAGKKALQSSVEPLKRLSDAYDVYLPTRRAAGRVITRGTKRLEEIRKTTEEQKKLKQSLPLPVGNFETKPKIALVVLLFFSAAAYLVFAVAVKRLRRMARAYARLRPGRSLTHGLAAPSWLATGDFSLASAFSWKRPRVNLAVNIVIHAAMLTFIAMLALEIRRVGAMAEFMVGTLAHVHWRATLGIACVAAAAIFVAHLAEWRSRNAVAIALRREVLAAMAAGVTLLVAGRPLARWWERRNAVHVVTLGRSAWSDQLITNGRTGIVHHERICRDHLPPPRYRRALVGDDVLHDGLASHILRDLARELLGTNRAEAMRLMAMAIERSPLSIHLYDELHRWRAERPRLTALLQLGIATAEREAARQDVKNAARMLQIARELRIRHDRFLS